MIANLIKKIGDFNYFCYQIRSQSFIKAYFGSQ